MEIILSQEMENAVVREYGSTDFLQAYINTHCDYLIGKQKEADRIARINKIMEADEADLDAIAVKVDAAREAKAQAEAEAQAEKPIEG